MFSNCNCVEEEERDDAGEDSGFGGDEERTDDEGERQEDQAGQEEKHPDADEVRVAEESRLHDDRPYDRGTKEHQRVEAPPRHVVRQQRHAHVSHVLGDFLFFLFKHVIDETKVDDQKWINDIGVDLSTICISIESAI